MNKILYKIPNRRKKLLTTAFYKTLKEEIDAVFKYDEKKIIPTYCNSYSFIGGTAGFQEALKNASKKHNLTNAIYNYSVRLRWDLSDWFDDEIITEMKNFNIIEYGNEEDLFGGYPTDEQLREWEETGEIKWVEEIETHKGYRVISRYWEFID